MELKMDHYKVLGLSSSSELDCTKLTEAEIKAAYRKKALELHPDTILRKRKRNFNNNNNFDDYNVRPKDDIASRTAAFQQLQSSYALLMNKEARERFDQFWFHNNNRNPSFGIERRQQHHHHHDWRRGRNDPDDRIREERDREERRRMQIWNRERNRFLQQQDLRKKTVAIDAEVIKSLAYLDKSKILKVSWNKDDAGEYNEEKICELFGRFGEFEKVMTNEEDGLSSGAPKNRGIALVVMQSMESVVAATAADWDEPPFIVWPLGMLP